MTVKKLMLRQQISIFEHLYINFTSLFYQLKQINGMIKKNLLLIFIAFAFFSAEAINNTIAFVSQSGINCEFSFRDTAGTRTFTPTIYYWDFGNGQSSNSRHAVHDYLVNGSYVVKHIISDGSNSDTAVINIVVACKANNPLAAAFYYNINDTVSPTEVYFSNMSDGRIISHTWNFGDGNTSSNVNPVHAYMSMITQTYTVCLLVIDSSSRDSFCQNVTIKAFDSCKAFFAGFNWQHDTSCNGILFSNASHYTAMNYQWSFGDGSSSTQQNPYHQYSNQVHTSYYVKLKASGNNCSDSTVQEIKPKCKTCYSVTALINLAVDSLDPSKAILYNRSFGALASHRWDFGDGDTSTLAAPTHVYTSPGPIHLVYVVRDTSNCTDTFELFFEIDSLGRIKRGTVSFTLQVIDRTNNNSSSINDQRREVTLLNIYPQPAGDKLYLSTETAGITGIVIYDATGREIHQSPIQSGSRIEISTAAWPQGLYLLRDNKGSTYRIVIRR